MEAGVHQDIYSKYETGLRQLLSQMKRDHSRYHEALVYQQRLIENISKSRLHGDTDTRRAERSEIIGYLNELALSVLGVSFSALCGPITPIAGQERPERLQADEDTSWQAILRLLDELHNEDPDDRIECARLAKRLRTPEERVRSNVKYLADKGYIAVDTVRRGARRYKYVRITTEGIDLLEHPERFDEALQQEFHYHYYGDYIDVKVGDHSRNIAIGKEIDQVNVDSLDPAKLSPERHGKGFAETSGEFQVKGKAQVFLSYAREDKEKVEKLYQKLSNAGFKPWMDTKDILPGEKWESCIQRAIRHSDFFLVCLSANSIDKRGWIQREIKQALDVWQERLDSDIYLIPVRLEDCEAPESLRDFQWVDLFEKGGWTRLVKAIQVGMGRRA